MFIIQNFQKVTYAFRIRFTKQHDSMNICCNKITTCNSFFNQYFSFNDFFIQEVFFLYPLWVVHGDSLLHNMKNINFFALLSSRVGWLKYGVSPILWSTNLFFVNLLKLLHLIKKKERIELIDFITYIEGNKLVYIHWKTCFVIP